MRYNQTERLGIIATDFIVTKDLSWIFREQPIADVGIDGLIEETQNGSPTGKFLAVQVKSGKGNFHIADQKITYYVSNVHYHYWLSIDMPVILVAHFPDDEVTYWQQINVGTLKKTHKRWKIEIPSKQQLNASSKERLLEILYTDKRKSRFLQLFEGGVDEETIYDIIQDTDCIEDSVGSLTNIIEVISSLKEKINSSNADFRTYLEKGLSGQSPLIKARIKGFAKDLNIASARLETETVLYSKLYSTGLFAFEQLSMISFSMRAGADEFNYAFQKFKVIPVSIDHALAGIEVMRNGVNKLPKIYPALKEARRLLLEIIDMIIAELNESKKITEEMVFKLKDRA